MPRSWSLLLPCLLAFLFAGCSPPPESPWLDLMCGKVQSRSITEDHVSVTFTDGGLFSTDLCRMGKDTAALMPGVTYVVQYSRFLNVYRFVQVGAENQVPKGTHTPEVRK